MSQVNEILATVIICTRDRAASLARTLDSLVAAASLITDTWEVIIVDNGSSDDTTECASSYSGSVPIRVVAEPKAGLSNARNAGVRASKGEFILWTDDDVLVDKRWLSAWFSAFKGHPDCAVFGGRSKPVLQEPKQAWFENGMQHMASLLAVRDEPSWTEVTSTQIPYGLNYAVRGKEQRSFLYDPELGVAPGRRRGGEEVAVLRAILATGAKGRWVWEATVYHLIPPGRQTAAYIIQFYRSNGYDFPICGDTKAPFGRLIQIYRTSKVILKASLRVRRAGDSDTKNLILLGRAQGSMMQYLGRKG